MRIISGSARGRRLKEPQGMDTRPTTDKVKESLFNIIQFELEGRRVLDLYAGTGQLGLEALSRGAEHCTFVDQRREAAALVRENVKLCGFTDRARVAQEEALSFLSACREKFDVVLLDPPYESGLLEKSLKLLTQFDILREHGIIVCESGAEDSSNELLAAYAKRRRAHVVVKGLRAVSDFEQEVQMAVINRHLNPKLETMFLASSEKYTYLSSTIVKEMARYGADLADFVPREIVDDVNRRMREMEGKEG